MLRPVSRSLHHLALRTASSAHLSPITMIDASEPIEEETLPGYLSKLYYPVSIGQVINDKYEILAKLGFGSESTVWLAKDVAKYLFFRKFFSFLILTQMAFPKQPIRYTQGPYSREGKRSIEVSWSEARKGDCECRPQP